MISTFLRHSAAKRPPLRVGLLLDDLQLIHCFAEVVRDIQASDFASIVLLIRHRREVAPAGPRRSRVGAILHRLGDKRLRKRLLFDLYTRWDERHVTAENPLALEDCSATLSGIETIWVEPLVKGFIHRFPDEAVVRIRDKNLDVLLRFGFNILHGDILSAARYGVWSFHHGDNDRYRGGPPHFWELVEEHPLSGVMLQVLTEKLDAGRVLCKSLYPTQFGLSLANNQRAPYLGTTHFVIRRLKELHERGWPAVEAACVPPRPYEGRRPIYRAPSNGDMVNWLARKGLKRVRTGMRSSVRLRWKIALRTGGPALDGAAVAGAPFDARGFHWIDAPAGRFYADPFLRRQDGRTWLFFEEYSDELSRAWISVAEVLPSGILGPVQPCLQLDSHLSFPFVFGNDDEHFMVPESAHAGQVRLYRARAFPHDWVLDRVLLEGPFVDTVIWSHQHRVWLLTTLSEANRTAVHSLLFSAPSLRDDFRLHGASPLFGDARCARNAGRVTACQGRLLRVSQDCSTSYGRSFRFNEITDLNEDTFRERPLATYVGEEWSGLVGTHTYDRAGDIEVIDGCFAESR